ncbi:hypothetical protein C1Y31_25785 [Pseudomonas sp. FW305-25]|nr:hypothetical protein C1Y31_25785 [Pseudomonas sp. FW305-25]PMY64752.1 hypothetical protein C1Y32_24410 [Pseudomonas sp. FW126-L8]PNA76045.1 hypothetical protein C1Y33_20835 [Pseudomonas sp. FW305-76]
MYLLSYALTLSKIGVETVFTFCGRAGKGKKLSAPRPQRSYSSQAVLDTLFPLQPLPLKAERIRTRV